MLIDAGPELMTELVPTSDSVRRRLPRWDPRLWSGHELLQMAKTRNGAELRRLGLTWGRARAQKASSSRPPADPARNDATPPCRAQQAPAVDRRPSPALASTALGGVGGPQAAVLPVTVVTPRSDAAEDRRRWASPGYLSANGMRLGRLHYEPPARGEPQLAETPSQNHAPNLHVLLNLPDHLGSSSIILDHATGELVEARTYQPYGATESDYRPGRWKGFREDYGFTGKEEDVEVGLTYFGKRFLSPYLGRWMSADPLAVHSPGQADLNLYAYVRGAVLKAVDPLGLQEIVYATGTDAKTGAQETHSVDENLETNRTVEFPTDKLVVAPHGGKAPTGLASAGMTPAGPPSSAPVSAPSSSAPAEPQMAFLPPVPPLRLAPRLLPAAQEAGQALSARAMAPTLLLAPLALCGDSSNCRSDPKVDRPPPPPGPEFKLYRGMRAEGGMPEIGASRRTLGVVSGPEARQQTFKSILRAWCSLGQVACRCHPRLPVFRGIDGPQQQVEQGDPVWSIRLGQLGPLLKFAPDSPTHGTVQPSGTMDLGENERALGTTAPLWQFEILAL